MITTEKLENYFNNRKVVVTGHTGFKGSWLTLWLKYLGAEVTGISNGIVSRPSHFKSANIKEKIHHFNQDIREFESLNKIIKELEPDYVFHLAAQALVTDSYQDPLTTFSTNAIGTANILESLRHLENKCVAVFITSDKCYENVEWCWGYRENDRLGGKDPYSASKASAELVIHSYIHSFLQDAPVHLGIARAGNVIGGGDWARNRILPDCVRAWAEKEPVQIRSPEATRPWQHVLEPLSGYLTLAMNLQDSRQLHGEAFNFGPDDTQEKTVRELIVEFGKHWDQAVWENDCSSSNKVYEAGLLKLNCDKAKRALGWSAALDFKQTVKLAADWYRNYYEEPNAGMYDFSMNQIEKYSDIASRRTDHE